MARDGDDVTGLEDWGLLENLLADFAERQAVGRRIETVEPSGGLDGLEGDAADAFLLQGEVDDLADFAVVETFLENDDEGRGDVVFVETVDRFASDVGKIFTAKFAKARRF